ncbi:MAG: hypothetical protein FWD18_04520 [Micrococcales bacterium]|nr:hypothetical protein [Micrococcales bacterium]
MSLAFVDANVLVSPVPRTILYLGAAHGGYTLVYSKHVEHEAERHQRPQQVPVSTLRARWGWRLVPDPKAPLELTDTDTKDRPVLTAAAACDATFLLTANVRDFGDDDLTRLGISAVHPGLFAAHHLSLATYRSILTNVGARRAREPRNPLAIHEQEIAVQLPALFERYRDAFGPARTADDHQPPAVQFRGHSCVRCTGPLTEPDGLLTGLCPSCRNT